MTEFEYRCFEGELPCEDLGQVVALNQEIFGFNETAEQLAYMFSTAQQPLSCLAFQDGCLVGFKIGFQQSKGVFESWRGGVQERLRGQGIATELMRQQHIWCKEKSFKLIKTTTNSDNAPMLIANLLNGFQIVGTFVNQRNKLKVLLEKSL